MISSIVSQTLLMRQAKTGSPHFFRIVMNFVLGVNQRLIAFSQSIKNGGEPSLRHFGGIEQF